MARMEQDREDLMREAVRLRPRGEFLLPGHTEPVFVGFRPQGGPSFYFGPDEVYQFNAAGELRRAYLQAALYKAQDGRLVRMVRRRTERETQLVSRVLAETESRQVLRRMYSRLEELRRRLQEGTAHLQAELPAQGRLPWQVLDWLKQHPQPAVAATPRALAPET